MKVTPIKTKKIVKGDDLYKILEQYLPAKLEERTIVAVSSKIVGITEGRIVKNEGDELRDKLAKEEAQLYLPREYNQYGFMITINQNIMVASAGIDQSNGNGYLVLWPKNPQKSANQIREYLTMKYRLSELGVIITDSKLTPLRMGVTGVALAHSGFEALIDYVGKPDVFGRIMQAEKTNVADSLAISATVEMGEGAEQQPLALLEDVSFVKFQKRNPTKKELDNLRISIGVDVYSSMLTSVKWIKGGK